MSVEEMIIQANHKENRHAQIQEMFGVMKQYNVVVTKIQGRKVYTEDHRVLYDFASCNYLGLDLDHEMLEYDLRPENKKWGMHPSWARLFASPHIYHEAEEKLAHLIGTESALILPTVSLISVGVIPALVGKKGVIFLDKSAHINMYEAAKIARDSGATMENFPHQNFEKLEELLHKHKANQRKVILVDGVYSMSGDYIDIPRLQKLAKKYDALIYVDDAHGFGVVGENPTKEMPFGFKGNGIVKFHGCNYDNILYIGGCSKAFSCLNAFIGCSKKMRAFLQAFITPYTFSGPCQVASLATLIKGLEINEKRGNGCRKKLWELSNMTITGLRELGFNVDNRTGYPIIFPILSSHDELIEASNLLYDNGILVTVAAYPIVAKNRVGPRISLTAANTAAEVEHLLLAFVKIKNHLEAKRGHNKITGIHA